MKTLILAMIIFFAGVAAASEKGQDDTMHPQMPEQERMN